MLTASDAVREREHCRCNDQIQRKKEERVLLAQPNWDTKRRDAQDDDENHGRIAGERNGAEDRRDDSHTGEYEPGRLREQESKVVVADERAPDACGREPEQCKACEGKQAATRDEHEHGAHRADERCNLCGVGVLHDAGRYAFAG